MRRLDTGGSATGEEALKLKEGTLLKNQGYCLRGDIQAKGETSTRERPFRGNQKREGDEKA